MTQALPETIHGHLKQDEALSLISTLSGAVARNIHEGGSMVQITIEQGWHAGQPVIIMRVGRNAETFIITETEMPT